MHHVADELFPGAGSNRDDEQTSVPEPDFLDEPDAEAYFDFLGWEPACNEHLFDGLALESLSESEAPFDSPSDSRRIASVACDDANLPAADSPAWDPKPFFPFLTSRHDYTWGMAARMDERVSSLEVQRACRQRLICYLAPATCTTLRRMRRGATQSGPLGLRCHI